MMTGTKVTHLTTPSHALRLLAWRKKIQKQRILELQTCSMVMTRVIRSKVILVGAAPHHCQIGVVVVKDLILKAQ
jgi:hypothetical protein